MTASEPQSKQQRTLSPIMPGWAVVLFTINMLVMIGHEAEHVVQVFQKWNGNQCPFECKGLMGNLFDVEWVHWGYNISTFLILVVCWLGMRMWLPQIKSFKPWAWWSLTLGIFAVQGYHVMEHSAKIGQWLINGHHSPTPGILGALMPPPTRYSFSLIEMHFTINTIVFIMVSAGYLGYAIWRLLPASLRIKTNKPWQLACLIVVAVLMAAGAFWISNTLLHQDHHQSHSQVGMVSDA